MAYKMKGNGKVYYEGDGSPININPNDLSKGYFDEYGNKAYDHKKTKDVFYEKKPRFEGEKEGPANVIPLDWWRQERNIT
tara:strand:- start:356 stop:595 length:240 start_codon:yes stop_codon:yes gene_type:complete